MRLILGSELEKIREKISCIQFGDDHYGEWGILTLNQRRTILRMIETIRFLDEMVEQVYKGETDFAKVVRCKDCKRCWEKRTKRNKQLMRFCMRMEGNEYQVNANDFCSYGVRKGGD